MCRVIFISQLTFAFTGHAARYVINIHETNLSHSMIGSWRSGSCEVLGRCICASFCASLLKMAPVLEKKLLGAVGTGDTMDNSNEDEEGQNLWYAGNLRLSKTELVLQERCLGERVMLCHQPGAVQFRRRSRMSQKHFPQTCEPIPDEAL